MKENQAGTTTNAGDVEKQPEPVRAPAESVGAEQAKVALASEALAQDSEKETVPVPTPVTTYTTEELEKRINSVKGGYEGTIQKLKNDYRQAQDEIARARAEAEEVGYTKFIQDVEKAGGDVNVARQIVETQKQQAQRETELRAIEEMVTVRMAALNEFGRQEKASTLVKELGLPAASKEELLKAETPEQMETKALRLALQSRTIAAQPPLKTDSNIKSGKSGRDLSQMGDAEKMGYALEQIMRQ